MKKLLFFFALMAGAAVQYCGAQNYTVYAGAVPGATEYVFVTNGSHAVGFVTEDFRPCESMPLKVTNVTPTSLVMMADGFDSSCNARVSANNIKIADFGEYGVFAKGTPAEYCFFTDGEFVLLGNKEGMEDADGNPIGMGVLYRDGKMSGMPVCIEGLSASGFTLVDNSDCMDEGQSFKFVKEGDEMVGTVKFADGATRTLRLKKIL